MTAAPPGTAPPIGRLCAGMASAILAAIPIAIAIDQGNPVVLVLLLVAVPPLVLAARPWPAAAFRTATSLLGLGLLSLGVLAFFFGGLVLVPSGVLLLLAATAPSPTTRPLGRVVFALLVACLLLGTWLVFLG